ncbi:MAG: glycosyltransferase, partial [Clostridia bacterium]|nr:glycosyltransferase [Clostridia bacterium]
MNSNPLVSVIMGVYNCADTVDSAIKSIINQTYKNWELIICDDGSQDDTISIVQKYIALYPQKIFLIK